ncbi:hypothetical protein I4U23_023895 [Adineta vaga]|nr:hypothetical protein I4U23_023895 [Adineta vaga]
MNQLTIAKLCQVLGNLTRSRPNLAENSSICRCFGDIANPMSSTVVVSSGPDIMLSEVILILFVLAVWLSAIGFCLNQYKSLRRLETQVHYCVDRKDPVNIGDIKIVEREQDSIIYKKKRYSTLLDTNITSEELKTMHYVHQYLPKNSMKTIPSTVSALVIGRDDLLSSIPLSTTTKGFHSAINISLTTHEETAEEDVISNSNTIRESYQYNGNASTSHPSEMTRHSTALTIPHIYIPNSLHSSWNASQMYDTSCSTQHLCVPTAGLRSNRFSDGNISLPVPQMTQTNVENPDEQLLDPRLIPATVRRSLLALHRESQENIMMYKRKEQTQSENDVHGVLSPIRTKMKSKLKHTHPQLQQAARPHANTLSILPNQLSKNDYELYILENISTQHGYKYSTPPIQRCSNQRTQSIRRSFRNCPKYSTQSTSESETTQVEVYVPISDEKAAETIIETSEKSP